MITAVLLSMLAGAVNAETLHLKDGSVLQGTVISADTDTVKVQTPDGVLQIKKERIENVDYAAAMDSSPSPSQGNPGLISSGSAAPSASEGQGSGSSVSLGLRPSIAVNAVSGGGSHYTYFGPGFGVFADASIDQWGAELAYDYAALFGRRFNGSSAGDVNVTRMDFSEFSGLLKWRPARHLELGFGAGYFFWGGIGVQSNACSGGCRTSGPGLVESIAFPFHESASMKLSAAFRGFQLIDGGPVHSGASIALNVGFYLKKDQ